ncbi:C-3 sterol dehydrogenase/C-4 decarboxylase family protein [Usnea florida]
MASQKSSFALGPAVVIGGCGFVGYHIVQALLKEPTCASVSVISRSPRVNCCEGVTYYRGDISNLDEIRELLAAIKPRIIFHAAAPRAGDPAVRPDDHYTTSLEGTKNVLACAIESPTAKALVYTSTCAVSKGYQHFNINETAPLWDQDSKTIPYFKTKALADVLTREANSPINHEGRGLLTATLRLPFVYGERDNQTIPSMLKTAEEGQTKIQLGDNKNLVEPTYIGNIATAHLLAARKLLESENGPLNPRVDGEAFHITDGDPQPFWTFARMIWRTAGDETTPEQVTTVPGWLALLMARGIEWAFFVSTLGTIRPPLTISPLYIQYTVYNSTYDISKARTRLGYRPVVDKEGHLSSSVAWELENNAEKYRKLLKIWIF